MELRPYQVASADELRAGYRSGIRRQCLVSPTGSGKTVLFAFVTKNAVTKGNRVMIIAHRAEILAQISRTLNQVGVEHGMIQSGVRSDPSKPVHVASVQTLVNRFDDIPAPDFIVLDEAHHAAAGTWVKVFARYDKARYLGVTATPERLDGRGLNEFFEKLVLGPSVQWLIDNKFLARPRYFAPQVTPDLSAVRKMAGDFSKSESEAIIDKPSITGDAVLHYKRHLYPRTAVAFCISLSHAQHVAECFRSAGVPADVIDGKMSDEDRTKRVTHLANGQIKVLVSCELISEGFDLPSTGGAILLRPTASLALCLQQIGRALRPKQDGSEAVILDHVGNVLRHGLAEEPRNWTLEGRSSKKRTKEAVLETRQCETCFCIFAGLKCPECGVERASKVREIEQREGELRELETKKMAEARAARIEVGRAQSYEALIAIEKSRGYKRGWAFHRWRVSRHNPANNPSHKQTA